MTVCTDADIVTTALLAGDDELARRLVELKNAKSAYEDSLAVIDLGELKEGTKTQKEALNCKLHSVDMQIRQIINYKILTGDKQAGAYQKLANEMIKQGRNAGATISLLNKLDASSPIDLESVAKYFAKPGEDTASAIKRIQDNIANVGTAIAEQEKYINSIPTIDEAIKQKKSKAEIKKLIEEKAALDKKNIKKGLNPDNFADPDNEWGVIKNTTDNVDEQYSLWGQYVLANAIIGDADASVLKAIKQIYNTKNSVGKLTADQIFAINSLDELMARAYTNVNDLVEDGMLRSAYKERFTQLTTGLGVTESTKKLGKGLVDQQYAERLINLSRFADDGAAFTTIVKHDAVGEAARKMGIEVSNSSKFYDALIDTLKEDKYLDNITKDGKVKLVDGTELTVNNMLELVYVATGDRTLPRLLREGTFSTSSLLDIGTQVLLGNKEEATKKLFKLVSKVKELPSLADSKDLALMTLTGKKIQPNAPKAFFNYRQMYNQDDMLEATRLKADFMERMANANRAEVSVDGLEDFSNLKGDVLKKKLSELKGGYIIVNDAGWMNNTEFADILNQVNKEIKDEGQQIQVLFPRQAQMSNFTMDNGKLVFRSIDSRAYRDMMDNVSIRTLGDAEATRELTASTYEALNGVNADNIRFQASYGKGGKDNLGRTISDQQLDFGFVKGDDGNIKTFYHWTPYEFDEFNLDHFRTGSGDSLIPGFYFADQSKSKIIMNPKQANRLIEVYLKADNPLEAGTGITEVFTLDSLTQLIRDYNTNIGRTFDEKRWGYKLQEWIEKDSSMEWFFHNTDGYPEIFGNYKDFMAFFKEYTGIDGIWDADGGVMIVFSPNQIKYVDNRLPSSSRDMRFQIREDEQLYLLPTEKEYDEFLKTHDVDKELKEMFGTTNDPAEAIFITKDGEFISGYGLPDDKYKSYGGIQVEHGGALMALLYGDRSYITNGEGAFKLMGGQTLIDMFEKKTGVIRVRPSLKGYAIQLGGDKITKQQEYALKEILEDFNKNIYQDKEIFIESGQSGQNFRLTREFTNNTGVYTIDNIKELIGRIRNEKYFEALVESHNKEVLGKGVGRRIGEYVTPLDTRWQRRAGDLVNEADIGANDAKKIQLFNDGRTVEDIANSYGIPFYVVHDADTIAGVKAYGAYGNGVIYFTDLVKESTAPHELYHAVFDIVDEKTRVSIINNSKKLFGYNDIQAEEALADAFSEWFRTGKFSYADASKLTKKEQKTFFNKVQEFFTKIKEWLDGVDAHRNEVEQLFNDMVNCKYLKNEGKPINKYIAAGQATQELEESANKYFASMLGITDWDNPNFRDTVHGLLEDTTGIPIKSLRDLAGVDKGELWRAVDTQFTNAQKVVGNFKNEVVDITARMNQIANYSLDELKNEVSNVLDGLVVDDAFTEANEQLIKQALQDFDSASTIEEWLETKGRLLSLANGGRAERFTLDELKNIFRNGSQATEYKAIFFPNQELTEKETTKYVKQINNLIFDGLTGTIAQNLAKMGYSLPLDNARSVVLDFLMGNLDMNDNFIKSFLYKNGLPDSKALMESIIDSAMPRELKLGYEDSLYTLRKEGAKSGMINRIVEEPNPFLADTYSSLVSLVNARVGNLANGNEAKYLSSLLDKYSSIVKEKLKTGINFEEAQQLKMQLGYALDVFEQDILMPKYGRFISPDRKAAIRNMKSYVTIVVGKEGEEGVSKAYKQLLEANNRISSNFMGALEDVLDKYSVIKTGLAGEGGNKVVKQAKEFKDKLKANGTVIGNVNGELVIVDAKTQLKENLSEIPTSIKGLGELELIPNVRLDDLDNNTVFFLNQLTESAKKLDAMAKWETTMMYNMDPELNAYRFFNAFRLVDDGGERVPMALVGDILSGNPNLAKYNTMGVNNTLKKDIFNGIKSRFYKDGGITINELKGVIQKALKENTSQLKTVFADITKQGEYNDILQQIQNQYVQAFMPYTHLKDIPSTSLDGITDVRGRINSMLEEQVESIREAMEGMPSEYRDLLNKVEVTTPTGQTITIQQFLDGVRPNWKKAIFDDEDILVKTADEFGLEVAKSSDSKEVAKIEKINTDYRRRVSNEYNETLQAIQNQQRIISEGERKLTSRMLNNARSTARKFTLTNRLVEATDMVSGLEEEASRMMKSWLLGWKNIITFGKYYRDEALQRLEQVKEAYKKFYNMGLDAINTINPKNEAEELAQHLCRYFKNIERHLGSVDGATGVTTKANINRAFYNIGEVVNNIESIEGIYALQSAIEQNQILKFFRFSEPGQVSYVSEFTRPATARTEDIFGGYREYITKLPDNINVNQFNDIFASNFTDTEFKMLYQALAGVTYVGGYGKNLNRFLNLVNGSNFVFRFLMSYPGQLLTIPQQGIAYFLKQKGFEKQLGIEDMSEIDRIRMEYGTLDKAYNEINILRSVSPDDVSINSYYNRYGTPDISDAYKGAALELTDDVNDMYGKMMEYQSTWDNMGKLQRSLDAYKDNANNIIDGLFARNFKNIAFLKGIRENAFMQFSSAEAFEAFMKDSTISRAIKDQLMDAVNASTGRNFRNILGLGFGGLDRAIGGSGLSNIFYGLMQFFNFRGAWGQNIFRQTGETFLSAFKMLPMGFSPEGRNAIATYIAQTPEFTNFVSTLFNDMQWTWKMLRYQDNGRWSELDNEYDIFDFLDYSVELLNMTSQWWQGINSFGPARPILEGTESIYNSLENPEVYKDVYGVGAFFNSLGKNAGRNRKPINYAFQAIQALEEGGPEGVQAYLQNQFWKLSFGSLRYMMNEDANDYGFTYEYLQDESGIPSIIRGEGSLGSIKSFSYDLSNNNTWNAMQQVFGDGGWDEKKTYLGDIWGAMINGSNAWNSIKNAIKATPYYDEIFGKLGLGYRKSPRSFDSFSDVIYKTSAGKELIETGKVTPKTPSEVKAFITQFIDEDGESSNRSAYKPFGENFAEAISNYNQFGHIKGEQAHSGDQETEFMLSQIRYEKDSTGKFIEKNGKKVETPLWNTLVTYIKAHPTDLDTTSLDVSKEIFKWVEDNNDDPNYLLYQSLIGQGMADMYLTNAWNDYQDAWNELFGGKKAVDKINKTEAQNSGWYWDNFMKYLLNTKVSGSDVNLVEYLQRLDRQSAMSSYMKIIKDQMVDDVDKNTLERYVTFYTDSYGNEKSTLNSQYASQIEALGGIGDAIEKGNLELMMGRASSFANTYLKDDATGLVKASAITSLINKIRSTDISPKLKLEMIAALGENQAEFLQTHLPEMIAQLGEEAADALLGITNEHIYEWDGAVNAAIGDAIMAGDGEAAKKGSGTSSKFKSALAVTSKLKNGAGASRNGYGGRTNSSSTIKWVPYTLDIAKLLNSTGGKGYSPKQTDINIKTYKPKVDLSIGKDVSRSKTVQKTQAEKKSKVVL